MAGLSALIIAMKWGLVYAAYSADVGVAVLLVRAGIHLSLLVFDGLSIPYCACQRVNVMYKSR